MKTFDCSRKITNFPVWEEVGQVDGNKRRPVDTGRNLNVQKTFRGRPGRLLNVLCTFNLRPVSTGHAPIFIIPDGKPRILESLAL